MLAYHSGRWVNIAPGMGRSPVFAGDENTIQVLSLHILPAPDNQPNKRRSYKAQTTQDAEPTPAYPLQRWYIFV